MRGLPRAREAKRHSQNRGLETKQPENRRGENTPDPDSDGPAADSLVEAIEAAEGYVLLSESLDACAETEDNPQ